MLRLTHTHVADKHVRVARHAWAGALVAIAIIVGCTREPAPAAPPSLCCCEFLVQGDILKEDLVAASDCPTRDRGRCIQVDPMRLTPHPCCPNAKGERCGS